MFVVSYIFSTTIMSFVRYVTANRIGVAWKRGCYPVGLLALLAGVYVFIEDSDKLDRWTGIRNKRGVSIEDVTSPELRSGRDEALLDSPARADGLL